VKESAVPFDHELLASRSRVLPCCISGWHLVISELLKRSCTWGWQASVKQGRHMRLPMWEPGSWPLMSFAAIACLLRSCYAVCSIFFIGIRIVLLRPQVTKLSLKKKRKYLLVWVNYIALISILPRNRQIMIDMQ